MTPSPTGILRSTFVDAPTPIAGMPALYQHANTALHQPAWFYLSASPYNLYPFLRTFLRAHYPPGTLVLRDASWMDLAGFLSSLTMGTQAYKVDRMRKIHAWLPDRKVVCVGDSTQSDPEAYGEMYAAMPFSLRHFGFGADLLCVYVPAGIANTRPGSKRSSSAKSPTSRKCTPPRRIATTASLGRFGACPEMFGALLTIRLSCARLSMRLSRSSRGVWGIGGVAWF